MRLASGSCPESGASPYPAPTSIDLQLPTPSTAALSRITGGSAQAWNRWV